eukprot:416180_1
MFTSFLFALLLTTNLTYDTVASDVIPAIIVSETDAVKVNEHFTGLNNIHQNASIQEPHPDITILSKDYYLCVWSYSFEYDFNSDSNTTIYSNEIFANLFRISDGKGMVKKK